MNDERRRSNFFRNRKSIDSPFPPSGALRRSRTSTSESAWPAAPDTSGTSGSARPRRPALVPERGEDFFSSKLLRNFCRLCIFVFVSSMTFPFPFFFSFQLSSTAKKPKHTPQLPPPHRSFFSKTLSFTAKTQTPAAAAPPRRRPRAPKGGRRPPSRPSSCRLRLPSPRLPHHRTT